MIRGHSRGNSAVALLCSSALGWAVSSPAWAQVPPSTSNADVDVDTENVVITVTGRRSTGYRADATQASRLPLDPATTPLSINIVPAELLEDQNVLTIDDAVRNVSGVVRANNTDNVGTMLSYNVRGFINFDMNRNGIPTSQLGAVDLAAIESIEVIKGPNSISYGTVEPGGFVNYTTKRPLDTFFAGLQGQYGSYDHQRLTGDVTGPVNDALSVRFIGAYQSNNSFRDFVSKDVISIAPSATLKIGPDTLLTTEVSYTRLDRTFDSGIIAGPDGDLTVPIDRFLGEPSLNGSVIKDTFVNVDLTHAWSENVSTRLYYAHHQFSHDLEAMRIRSSFTDANGDYRVRRIYNKQRNRTSEDQFYGMTTFKVSTGPLNHKITAFLDYRSSASDFDDVRTNVNQTDLSIDVLNPVYGINPTALAVSPLEFGGSGLKAWGTGVVDQIEIAEKLHLFAAVRYDNFEAISKFDGDQDGVIDLVESLTANNVNFQLGALYKITPNLGVYASYSTGVSPTYSYIRDREGTPLPAPAAKSIEAGIKADLLDESLRITAAVYQIEKTDLPLYVEAPDLANRYYYYEAGGLFRTRGFEIDVVGEVTEQLKVVASYSFIDAFTKDVTTGALDNPFGNIPRHSGSIWMNYDIPTSWLSTKDKLSLGGGVFYSGKRVNEAAAGFVLPAYTQVDAAISYETQLPQGTGLIFQLNATNLLNEEIYLSGDRRSLVPAAPRSVVFSAGIKF